MHYLGPKPGRPWSSLEVLYVGRRRLPAAGGCKGTVLGARFGLYVYASIAGTQRGALSVYLAWEACRARRSLQAQRYDILPAYRGGQRDIPLCGYFLFVRFARAEGRPCGALSLFIQSSPRVWSPFQGYAPWALEGLPRWGLHGCWWPIGAGCSWIVLCLSRGISCTVAASFLSASLGLRVRSSQL